MAKQKYAPLHWPYLPACYFPFLPNQCDPVGFKTELMAGKRPTNYWVERRELRRFFDEYSGEEKAIHAVPYGYHYDLSEEIEGVEYWLPLHIEGRWGFDKKVERLSDVAFAGLDGFREAQRDSRAFLLSQSS